MSWPSSQEVDETVIKRVTTVSSSGCFCFFMLGPFPAVIGATKTDIFDHMLETFPTMSEATKTHISEDTLGHFQQWWWQQKHETSRHFLAMIRAIKTGIFDHTLEDFQPTKTHISWEIGIYLTRCSPLCEGIMNRMFFDETSGHFPGVLGP